MLFSCDFAHFLLYFILKDNSKGEIAVPESEKDDRAIDELLSDIFAYMDALRCEHHLDVTVHWLDHVLHTCADRLLACNIHKNPFCAYLKTETTLWTHCIERQDKVLARAQAGEYCGMCWAGMTEWIYPVRDDNGKAVGFICVSGYGAERAQAMSRIDAVSRHFHLSRDELVRLFDERLNHTLPSRSELSPLIKPLSHMFTLLIHRTALLDETDGASTGSALLFARVTHHLARYYAAPVTLNALAAQFNCSVSHLSRLFRRYAHQNFRQYVNALRIRLAQTFLSTTQMSIQEITYAVGFTDSNYFSTVFRRAVGCSPRQYRAQHTQDAPP